jgi:transcriptional regulator with XRE-family HTH domain
MFSTALSTENLEKTREMLKERRVVMNMTQKEAAQRAGVNIRTLQHFEQTGEISFLNLLKLMSVYRMDDRVMKSIEDRSWWTIEQLERAESRKRAR